MEHQYMSYPMTQSSFFYTPEQSNQHGRFAHQPQTAMPMQQPMSDYFQFAGQMGYSRPRSTGPQVIYQPNPQYISQSCLTPAATPHEMILQKPMIMLQQEMPRMMRLDTNCGDVRFTPSTPTLSAGSFGSMDSPQAYALLPTPMETMGAEYFGQSFEGVKNGCEAGVFSDMLTGDEWNTTSPPMTPGKCMCM